MKFDLMFILTKSSHSDCWPMLLVLYSKIMNNRHNQSITKVISG